VRAWDCSGRRPSMMRTQAIAYQGSSISPDFKVTVSVSARKLSEACWRGHAPSASTVRHPGVSVARRFRVRSFPDAGQLTNTHARQTINPGSAARSISDLVFNHLRHRLRGTHELRQPCLSRVVGRLHAHEGFGRHEHRFDHAVAVYFPDKRCSTSSGSANDHPDRKGFLTQSHDDGRSRFEDFPRGHK